MRRQQDTRRQRRGKIRGYIGRMVLSVEFLAALVLQIPLVPLSRQMLPYGLARLITMLSIIAVYFIGGILRKKFHLRPLLRDS